MKKIYVILSITAMLSVSGVLAMNNNGSTSTGKYCIRTPQQKRDAELLRRMEEIRTVNYRQGKHKTVNYNDNDSDEEGFAPQRLTFQ